MPDEQEEVYIVRFSIKLPKLEAEAVERLLTELARVFNVHFNDWTLTKQLYGIWSK